MGHLKVLAPSGLDQRGDNSLPKRQHMTLLLPSLPLLRAVALYGAKARLSRLTSPLLACTHTALATTRDERVYLLYTRHHKQQRHDLTDFLVANFLG